MSGVRLEDVPESDRQYELIGGKKVWMPLRTVRAMAMASDLARKVHDFSEAHGLGQAYTHILYDLQLPGGVCRRPSCAFVSYERWPRARPLPPDEAWDVIPELAAEVVGPDDLADELFGKATQYLDAGVQLVWLVFPTFEQVYVYTPTKTVAVLKRCDVLDGGAVLPGFRLPLTELFPEPPAQSQSEPPVR